MKLGLCSLLIVVAACGGKSSDLRDSSKAPNTAESAGVRDPEAIPVPTTAVTPSGSDTATENGADCSVMRDETLQILADAVASAPRACAADGDCILYGRRPNCVYDCGLIAAVTDGALIDAAVVRVDAELCPAACLEVPSSCGGGTSPFDQPRAACRANECVLDSHLTVIRETFQQTLYPLLRNHCESCHSSDTRQQEPLFADPDVSRALDHALLFSWAGEGGRWRIVDPEASAFVQRLSVERHNCWSDCAANASEMLSAIVAWSDTQAERP